MPGNEPLSPGDVSLRIEAEAARMDLRLLALSHPEGKPAADVLAEKGFTPEEIEEIMR